MEITEELSLTQAVNGRSLRNAYFVLSSCSPLASSATTLARLETPPSLMKKRIRPLKLVSLAVCCVAICYIAAFVYRFDIFGAPVRSSTGWLGPLQRGDSHAVDIGKVWHTDSPDASLYRSYRPLCQLWLDLQGFSIGR